MVETLHRASCRRCPGCRSSPNLYCECLHGFGLLILASNIFLFCCSAANIHAFTPRSIFGHCVRDDGNYAHPSSTSHPLVSDNDDSRALFLTRPSPEDFRALITDSGLLSSFMRPLRKPSFFFGDSLTPDDELLAVRTEQWIYEVDSDRFFLPPIQRSHSLGYLHRLSVPRHMKWELVRRIHDLPVCSPANLSRPPWSEEMTGLLPGYAEHGYPTGDTLQVVQTFGRRFLELGLDYPAQGRADGWVSPVGDPWWSRMMTRGCTEFKDQLQQIQLLPALFAVRQDVRANVNNS